MQTNLNKPLIAVLSFLLEDPRFVFHPGTSRVRTAQNRSRGFRLHGGNGQVQLLIQAEEGIRHAWGALHRRIRRGPRAVQGPPERGVGRWPPDHGTLNINTVVLEFNSLHS